MPHIKISDAPTTSNVGENMVALFRAVVGTEYILVDEEQRNEYGHDKTEDYQFLPDLVIKPGTPQEVSEILKICNEYKIPTTPRGAGTGLSGGALPVLGGLLLSLERMNRILKIDENNLYWSKLC